MSITELPLVTQLSEGLQALNVSVTAQVQTKLIDYLHLLQKWNRAYNLTAIREPSAMLTKHILDSVAIMPYLRGKRVIDVGTGAGLPGIPLALLLEDWHFTLLDSNGKKTRFLIQAKSELALTNVEIVQARVEDYKPEHRFTDVVTRAFSDISDMIDKTHHLLSAAGQLVAMKGVYPQQELQKVNVHYAVHPLQVPGLGEQRHLVCLTELLS
jgi:16S rRNA (guanine527-N7)-methyltransferase